MNLILILLLLIIVFYICKKSNFGSQVTPPPPPSTVMDISGIRKITSLNSQMFQDTLKIKSVVLKNANAENTKLDGLISGATILKQKYIKDKEKLASAISKKTGQVSPKDLEKIDKNIKNIDTVLKTSNAQKIDNNKIIQQSQNNVNINLKKIYVNNNNLFIRTVKQNKIVCTYTIQCLNNIQDGMYLSGLGGKLAFDKKPFEWKIVQDKELFSIQAVSDSNYLNNSGNQNKLVFLGSRLENQIGATSPVTIDLSKIKPSWNPGTFAIKAGVLEYKPGNTVADGDLGIPYPVLDKNYYKVTINISTLTGNRSPITIKPLNVKIYNDTLTTALSTENFTAESNKTITFNMMATKTDSVFYIKATPGNKTDLLKIKSLTIQKLQAPAGTSTQSAMKPIPFIWIIKEDKPTSAFSISTGGNYLDCGQNIELKSVINPLTSLWTFNTLANSTN